MPTQWLSAITMDWFLLWFEGWHCSGAVLNRAGALVTMTERAEDKKPGAWSRSVHFSGSRILVWTFAPIVLLFIIVTPFHKGEWSAQSVILVVGVDALGILLLLALYNPKRFHRAGRAATGLVFLAFLAYLIDEIASGHSWHFGPRSEPSPVNALLGLVVFGVPCLRYTLVGRFGRKIVASDIDHWLTVACPHCGEEFKHHRRAMFGCTVASEKNRLRLTDFLAKLKDHHWQGAAAFSDFDAVESDVLAYAVKCGSVGVICIVRSPFELYENNELCCSENVSSEDVAEIEKLIAPTSWQGGAKDATE